MSNTSKLSDHSNGKTLAQLQESIILQLTTQLEDLQHNEAKTKIDINILKMNETDLIIQLRNLKSSLKIVKRRFRETQNYSSVAFNNMIIKNEKSSLRITLKPKVGCVKFSLGLLTEIWKQNFYRFRFIVLIYHF